MEIDLLNPCHLQQKSIHKLKRLVPSPNSYFLDVKCKDCQAVTTVFSHAQSIIQCEGCNTILAKPTGGKLKFSMGTFIKIKDDAKKPKRND